MSDPSTALDHLNLASDLLRQERISLSVVGRALTPEEIKRIDDLTIAERDIKRVVERLTNGTVNEQIGLVKKKKN